MACSSQRSTVGDGAFQKRRHQSGWHLDLGLRKSNAPSPILPNDREERERMEGTTEFPVFVDHEPEKGSDATAPPVDMSASLAPGISSPIDPGPAAAEAPHNDKDLSAPEIPKAKWNPWAVPAFVLALSTVAYAILGASEVIAVLALVLTLVVASIAVRRGRTYEWRGKGFAITALLIGCLAGLITVIALLAGV